MAPRGCAVSRSSLANGASGNSRASVSSTRSVPWPTGLRGWSATAANGRQRLSCARNDGSAVAPRGGAGSCVRRNARRSRPSRRRCRKGSARIRGGSRTRSPVRPPADGVRWPASRAATSPARSRACRGRPSVMRGASAPPTRSGSTIAHSGAWAAFSSVSSDGVAEPKTIGTCARCARQHREIARRIAKPFLLLVGGIVLLVDDDQAESRQRGEHRRTRADHDARLAAVRGAPRVAPRCSGARNAAPRRRR